MPHRIILDTDIGTDSDDAIALGLALASQEIELIAVTHVSGDTRRRAQISRRLLDLAGRTDVPVFAGCDVPRSRDYEFAWFGYEGDGIIEASGISSERRDPHSQLSTLDSRLEDEHAIHAIIRLLRHHDDIEIVAIGPLTNIASALLQAPDIAQRIKRLTIMGGYVRRVACGGGIIAPMVDYNLRIDAESSRIVLSSDIPMQLVPTDVTVQVWMTESQLRQIERSRSELLQCIARNIRHWSPLQAKIFTHLGARMQPDNVGFLHDPLALACVFDQTFCAFENLHIELVTEDGILRTREREHPSPDTHQLRIATQVDAERFQRFLNDRLSTLSAPRPSPAAGES
jgi:purine nucleosidase